MASMLSEIAAFEVMRVYSEVSLLRQFGTLIEVNLLGSRVMPRKVLKIPRCPVCSSLREQPSVTIHKDFSV
jgi:hypothetical protein